MEKHFFLIEIVYKRLVIPTLPFLPTHSVLSSARHAGKGALLQLSLPQDSSLTQHLQILSDSSVLVWAIQEAAWKGQISFMFIRVLYIPISAVSDYWRHIRDVVCYREMGFLSWLCLWSGWVSHIFQTQLVPHPHAPQKSAPCSEEPIKERSPSKTVLVETKCYCFFCRR